MINATRNIARKFGPKLAAASGSALALVGAAHAELPAAAAQEANNLKTDGLAAIGLVMVACMALWGLKKLATKMGWF